MNSTVQVIISAITAFVITATGVLVGVSGSGYELKKSSWMIAVLFGLGAAGKDVRSLLKLPPVNGNDPKP